LTKICFILDELYPADRGGIARLMHNVIHQAKDLDGSLEIFVVLAQERRADQLLSDHFTGIATLQYFRPNREIASRFKLEDLRVTSIFPKHEEPFTKELKILDAVLAVSESCGGLDHIEIPDHMGLGSIVLQAKRAGYAFEQTEITCRIHSSLSAIITAEPFHHAQNDWLAPRLEMERFALQHADRVVAHLPTIARFNRSHFGFEQEWDEKVEIEFPPVIWPPSAEPASAEAGKDFVFTSRFQPFKRPDLFIKAAITLLDRGSDFPGNFRLISYGFDPEYIDSLRLLVPARYRSRIQIQTNVSQKERLEAIRNGIIVQPSKLESLCVLAYEASAAGRPLLLASDCLAFGDNPHWINQENCLLFEPSPEGLADVMETSRTWMPSAPVNIPSTAPYFTRTKPLPKPQTAVEVAVLVGPIAGPPELSNISTHLEVLKALDIKVETFGSFQLAPGKTDFTHHRLTEGDFKSRQWQAIAQDLNEDAVVLCSPNSLPQVDFIEQGAKIVQPGVVYASNGLDTGTGRLVVYPGKFDTMSLAEPRISPQCLMLHKNDLARISTSDDSDLLSKLITRIARSDLSMCMSPAPHVSLLAYQSSAPSQKLLGFEAEPVWRGNFRRIGLAVKPSVNSGITDIHAIDLILGDQEKLTCSAAKPVQIEIDEARIFELSADESFTSGIFSIIANNPEETTQISVSLQHASKEDALALHLEGRNVRVLKEKQSYRMRWGPIWDDGPNSLVITAKKAGKLELASPTLTFKAM